MLLRGLPGAPLLGAVALRCINRAPSELSGTGIAVAGLAVGLVGMAALVVLRVAFAYDGR